MFYLWSAALPLGEIGDWSFGLKRETGCYVCRGYHAVDESVILYPFFVPQLPR
jgi:hypothetical protein